MLQDIHDQLALAVRFHDELISAARSLVNECRAIEALSANAIRESSGYTNLQVWRSRISDVQQLVFVETKAEQPVK